MQVQVQVQAEAGSQGFHGVPARFLSPAPSPVAPARATRSPLDALAALGTPVPLARDQQIHAEGEMVRYCYRVASGTIRLVTVLEDGRRQVAAFLMEGDTLGFASLGHYDFTAEAVSDAVVIRYRRAAIEQAAESDPALARALRETAARKLHAAHARIILLGRLHAAERIATFLLEMADRAPRGAAGLALPMGRADIADHLGLTVETVSRILSQLRREGALAVSGTSIGIRDRAALRRLCGQPCH